MTDDKAPFSNGQMGENVSKLDPLKSRIPQNPDAKFDISKLLDGAAEIGYRQCKQDIISTLIGIHDVTPKGETASMRKVLRRIIETLTRV